MSKSPFDQETPAGQAESAEPAPETTVDTVAQPGDGTVATAAGTKKGSRQRRNEKDKAEHALGVETRRVESLTKRAADASSEAERLNNELAAATARRDYLRQHPALNPQD